MIKKWDKFNNLNESVDVDVLLNNLLSETKTIEVSLNDIIYGSGVILVLENGIILEKISSDSDWKEYTDIKEFEKETNTSLYNEYNSNKSDDLLNLFNSFKSDLKIKEAYFEGEPSVLLELALKK